MIDRRENPAAFDEAVDLQELDEVHFLAVNLFELRQSHGWSQEVLADRAGMTQAQIARIEAGHANPTLRTITKLACSLDRSVSELLSDPEETGIGSEDWELSAVRVSGYEALESRSPASAEAVTVIWGEGGFVLPAGGGGPQRSGEEDRQPHVAVG